VVVEMASSIEVLCLNCKAVIGVITVGPGVQDERKWLACPECNQPLFTWEDRSVNYEVEGVRKSGKPPDDGTPPPRPSLKLFD